MRAVIQTANDKGSPGAGVPQVEEEPVVELPATTTTQSVVVWAPIRAAEDPQDKP